MFYSTNQVYLAAIISAIPENDLRISQVFIAICGRLKINMEQKLKFDAKLRIGIFS